MNRELEKLVDYALIDGYISDKEKQVLFKKAHTQGFDIDELELILEGRLNEINKTTRPKVDKCPNCGETLSGISKVCPSCDYIVNSAPLRDTETLNDAVRRLEESIYALKSVPNPGASRVIGSAVLTICTVGLYAIYKKFIKKERLFDRYAIINEKIEPLIDKQLLSLQQKYGEDDKTNKYLIQLNAERTAIISKRQKADLISAVFTFAIIGVVIYFILQIEVPEPKPVQNIESAKDKTERLIKEGHISQAKLAALSIDQGPEKELLLADIQNLEIDSLTTAGNYNEALAIARLIKNTDDYSSTMQNKINDILEKQINDLVSKKEFAKAKEQAELAQSPKRDYFITSIKVAESVEKEKAAQQKSITPAKKTRGKRKK